METKKTTLAEILAGAPIYGEIHRDSAWRGKLFLRIAACYFPSIYLLPHGEDTAHRVDYEAYYLFQFWITGKRISPHKMSAPEYGRQISGNSKKKNRSKIGIIAVAKNGHHTVWELTSNIRYALAEPRRNIDPSQQAGINSLNNLLSPILNYFYRTNGGMRPRVSKLIAINTEAKLILDDELIQVNQNSRLNLIAVDIVG